MHSLKDTTFFVYGFVREICEKIINKKPASIQYFYKSFND